jgi:hypothetical protein
MAGSSGIHRPGDILPGDGGKRLMAQRAREQTIIGVSSLLQLPFFLLAQVGARAARIKVVAAMEREREREFTKHARLFESANRFTEPG